MLIASLFAQEMAVDAMSRRSRVGPRQGRGDLMWFYREYSNPVRM